MRVADGEHVDGAALLERLRAVAPERHRELLAFLAVQVRLEEAAFRALHSIPEMLSNSEALPQS